MADVDGLGIESLGHGVLYKVLIISRTGRDICSGIARV